jgi:hypothetical protein
MFVFGSTDPFRTGLPMNETDFPAFSSDAPTGPSPALTMRKMLIFGSYLPRRQAPGLTRLDKS